MSHRSLLAISRAMNQPKLTVNHFNKISPDALAWKMFKVVRKSYVLVSFHVIGGWLVICYWNAVYISVNLGSPMSGQAVIHWSVNFISVECIGIGNRSYGQGTPVLGIKHWRPKQIAHWVPGEPLCVHSLLNKAPGKGAQHSQRALLSRLIAEGGPMPFDNVRLGTRFCVLSGLFLFPLVV